MCYHKSVPDKAKLNKLFDNSVNTDKWEKQYHHISGFSFKELPVLTSEKPSHIQAFKWGLIPSWVKTQEQAKESASFCLNAKSETIFSKPSFRTITKKRCLIFTDGFYEWRDVNKKKYPYFIHLKEQDAFAFGGLYDEWVNKETGEISSTTSIITTEANPLMAKIHNLKLRMPLIFDKQTMFEWIKPDLSKEHLQELMKPFPESKMEAYTISKLITSRSENPNQERVKEPFSYPELTEL
ncbi:MAG: hypothetical protein K0S53_672 [Bacteroidetes bacterium]|jgi:putative SOS response-associated peptidase YedK|nr:hypothetical protein [Bacteroidota bacterium]